MLKPAATTQQVLLDTPGPEMWGWHSKPSGIAGYHWTDIVPQLGAPALQVNVVRQPDFTWDVQQVADCNTAVTVGGWLVAELWGKVVQPIRNSAVGYITLRCAGALNAQFELDHTWRRFRCLGRIPHDCSAGDLKLCLEFGYDPQEVAVAGVRLLHSETPPADRTVSPAYRGGEPDAAWRGPAEERISRIRTAPLRIRVQNVAGEPLPNVPVTVEQVTHAFRYGSAVSGSFLRDESHPDQATYRATALNMGNTAVLDNDLKWHAWDHDPRDALYALDWLDRHGMQVRGHTLTWGNFTTIPERFHAFDDEGLRRACREHIEEEATAVRGRLVDWDVHNEPYIYHDRFVARVGMDAIASWFRLVHQIDPSCRLFVNDYDMLVEGGRFETHQDYYERFIDELLQRGAPVHGIGLQGHFRGGFTDIDRMQEVLDRFAAFGLPLAITEYDCTVSHGDEKLAVDALHDLATLCFAHPAVDTFLHWGFWENRHWRPYAALYRADWSPRPVALEWQRLWQEHWRTKTIVHTDGSGRCEVSGYLGDYQIVTGDTSGGRCEAKLTGEGAEVTLVMD